MNDELLKQALEEVMIRELDSMPGESELQKRYRFSEDFEGKMDLLIRATNRRYVTIGRYTIRKVMLAALLAVLFLTGCIGIKPIREAVIHFLVKENSDNSDIVFPYHDERKDAGFVIHEPDVPNGYVIRSEYRDEGYYEVNYSGSDHETLTYIQMIPDGTNINVDTEDISLNHIEIHGYEGRQYSKEGTNNIFWTDENCFYSLSGTCEMSVLEKMAEELMEKK